MDFRLKQIRTAKGVSQSELAAALNMNQNTVSRYETLERQADYEALIAIADFFGVTLDYLLGRTDDPS